MTKEKRQEETALLRSKVQFWDCGAHREYALYCARKQGKQYWETLHTSRSLRQCYLELEYPLADARDPAAQQLFFDSPQVVAWQYNSYIGTFVIDVSTLAKAGSADDIQRLAAYIRRITSDVLIILLCMQPSAQSQKLFEEIQMSAALSIEFYSLQTPDQKELAQFLLDSLSKDNRGKTHASETKRQLLRCLSEAERENANTGTASFCDELIELCSGVWQMRKLTEEDFNVILGRSSRRIPKMTGAVNKQRIGF